MTHAAHGSAEAAVPAGRRGRGVRTYLLGLVIGGLIPLTLFAGYVAYQSSLAQRDTLRASILSTARAMALAVDEHVRTRRVILEELAQSEALRAGDLARFHVEMVAVARLLNDAVVTLVRRDGTRVLFSRMPPGAPVPGLSDPDLVARVFETGKPQVSDAFTASVTKETVAAIGVPVVVDGAVRYSLHLTLYPADFIRLLTTKPLPETWISGIVDRHGRFIARVPDNESRVGQLASDGWRAILQRTREDSWDQTETLEGQFVYNGQSPAREAGFVVGIGVPAAIIDAPFRESLLNLAAGGCLVLGLGILIAVLVARRLTDGLQQLARAAEQVPGGACDPPRASGLREIDRIAGALVTSARTILRRTEERDQADRAMRATADDLRRLNETLEERIEAEIATRLRAEEALRQAQKMEAIGQLTGGIAHDFNNLLQVIHGNLEVLRERARDALPGPRGEELDHLARLALRGAGRASALTQRLLAFSRQQALTPATVAPNQLVGAMSELIQRSLGERIGIETALAGGVWPIFVDANQLENALLNLAVNARDAMPQGGTLTIETANHSLDAASADRLGLPAGDYVMIRVADTGEGIDPAIVDKVFDPFFTTKPIGEGSGLGLSQVYGFVRQSNGQVRIDSRPGAGTAVTIHLPRDTRAAPAAPAPTVRPVPRADAATAILVVEDDPDVRALSVAMIGRLGYTVHQAADGTAALAILQAHPEIALLFTDVGLPGSHNGRELANAALRERPGLKVLFTTGYARDTIARNGRLDPDVVLLAKPFSFAALAEKINDILGA